MGTRSISALERRSLAPAQNDVELIAKRPLRLGGGEIKFGNQPLPRPFVWNRLEDGIVSEERIAGKIHLRDQPRGEGRTEKRKVYMGRPPGILVVLPRVGPGFDGHETIVTVAIGQCAACAGKVGIEWSRMVVACMAVTAGGVGLPDLNQCPRHRAAPVTQTASTHDQASP